MKKLLFTLIFVFVLFSTNALAVSESDISAECACLIEAKTGKILFSKNADAPHAMASTTKIMTAIIALEEATSDDIVCMSAAAAATEGSSVYMEAGEKIRMGDLVYGLMLNSGNDAAVAIAEHISGGVEEFCLKMNEKARELGLLNTHFKNPNGLFEEGHYTTASDLAELTRYAMKNPEFCEIVKTKTKAVTLVDTSREIYFSNHNKLLSSYSGAIGVKTGYTSDTGRCLVSAAERDSSTVICVTLDAPNDWTDHKKLLDYGFSKIESRIIIEKGQVLKTAEINGRYYNFIAASESVVTLEKDSLIGALVNLKISDELTGPFEKGEKVGIAEVLVENRVVDTVDIVSAEEVSDEAETERIVPKEEGFFTKLLNMIIKFFLYT